MGHNRYSFLVQTSPGTIMDSKQNLTYRNFIHEKKIQIGTLALENILVQLKPGTSRQSMRWPTTGGMSSVCLSTQEASLPLHGIRAVTPLKRTHRPWSVSLVLFLTTQKPRAFSSYLSSGTLHISRHRMRSIYFGTTQSSSHTLIIR